MNSELVERRWQAWSTILPIGEVVVGRAVWSCDLLVSGLGLDFVEGCRDVVFIE